MEQCTILPLHTRKTTGSVTTQGGGSSLHRNPRIDALHGQSPISLPPSRFHQADALFLEHKVHNSSSSLHLCTRKIIGHSELCKIARRCNHLTLKVVLTVCPGILYP